MLFPQKCKHTPIHSKDECLKEHKANYEITGAVLKENDKFVVEDSTVNEVIIKCTIDTMTVVRKIEIQK
jgi:hypothetical protein